MYIFSTIELLKSRPFDREASLLQLEIPAEYLFSIVKEIQFPLCRLRVYLVVGIKQSNAVTLFVQIVRPNFYMGSKNQTIERRNFICTNCEAGFLHGVTESNNQTQ